MNDLHKVKLDDLMRVIDGYEPDGDKSFAEVVNEYIFKEYGEHGNPELKDLAIEYFTEHLNDE